MEGRFIGFASLFTRRRRERGRLRYSEFSLHFPRREQPFALWTGSHHAPRRGAAAATEDGDKIYRKVARHCSLVVLQDGQGWYAESK